MKLRKYLYWLKGQAVAVCCAGGAMLLWLVLNTADLNVPYVTLFPAIVLAAFFYGYSAGLTALLLCMVGALFLVSDSFEDINLYNFINLTLFLISAGLTLIVTGRLRSTLMRLRKNETRLRLAHDAAGVGDWEWDLCTQTMGWSDSLYQLLERHPANCKPSPKQCFKMIVPQDRSRVRAAIKGALQGPAKFVLECRALLPNGEAKWFVTRGEVIRDRNSKPVRIAAIVYNVDPRKEAERALKESEERYRSLFTSMSEGFAIGEVIADSEGNSLDYRLIDANRAYVQLTGIPLEEWLDRPAAEVWPNFSQTWIDTFAEVINVGIPIRREHYSLELYKWFEVYVFKLAMDRFGYLVLDITQRKEAERDRSQAEVWLKTAMQVAAMGTWEYDPLDQTVAASESMNLMFGIRHGGSRRPLRDYLRAVHPDDLKELKAVVRKAERFSGDLNIEYRLHDVDGRYRWFALRGAMIAGDDGRWRMFGAVFDVTERKQAEVALETAVKQREMLLQELNHRVSNNLQMVASLLQLQSNRIADPNVREHLEKAHQRVHTIASLHGKLYKGGRVGTVNFAPYLMDLCAKLSESLLDETQLHIRVQVEPAEFEVDQAIPLGLVVNELVTNAVKHAFSGDEAGEIYVNFCRHGKCHLLSVSDTGRGLPCDVRNGNKGLGMVLVDALVRQVGGTLEISKKSGAHFEVRLPHGT